MAEGVSLVTPISGLVDELSAAVDACLSAVTARVGRMAGDADDRTLAAALGELERLRRGVEAAVVTVVADVDDRGVYLCDGHRRPGNWLQACLRISGAEAMHRARTARLCHAHPAVAAELAAGRLGVAQAAEFARAYSNPRIRDAFGVCVDVLVDWALNDDHKLFVERLREWERLADVDGAHRDADTDHDSRKAAIHTVGGVTFLEGRFANSQGAAIAEVFDAFCDAEYRTDVDDAKARLGVDQPLNQQLARTAAQRRADALCQLILAAAGAPLDGRVVSVVVNVVIDGATFDEALLDLVDPLHLHRPQPAPPSPGCDAAPDGSDPGRRFCTTTTGAAVDPVAVAVHALLGHVRRVVIGSDGVIIDLGRRQRLFRGSARHAALLQGALDGNGRCIWPGCGRHHHCQIDHTHDWSDDGSTDIANSGIVCGFHNVFKTRGYTCRRDPHGRWHTYRPDGTELTAA